MAILSILNMLHNNRTYFVLFVHLISEGYIIR